MARLETGADPRDTRRSITGVFLWILSLFLTTSLA
jgi:hypothetical protein